MADPRPRWRRPALARNLVPLGVLCALLGPAACAQSDPAPAPAPAPAAAAAAAAAPAAPAAAPAAGLAPAVRRYDFRVTLAATSLDCFGARQPLCCRRGRGGTCGPAHAEGACRAARREAVHRCQRRAHADDRGHAWRSAGGDRPACSPATPATPLLTAAGRPCSKRRGLSCDPLVNTSGARHMQALAPTKDSAPRVRRAVRSVGAQGAAAGGLVCRGRRPAPIGATGTDVPARRRRSRCTTSCRRRGRWWPRASPSTGTGSTCAAPSSTTASPTCSSAPSWPAATSRTASRCRARRPPWAPAPAPDPGTPLFCSACPLVGGHSLLGHALLHADGGLLFYYDSTPKNRSNSQSCAHGLAWRRFLSDFTAAAGHSVCEVDGECKAAHGRSCGSRGPG